MPERIILPAASSPRVSVIIPVAAEPELLLACLRSLAQNGPPNIPFETIVVLNAAPSEVEARLRATETGVLVESSPVNLGLAGAASRGRAVARGEYLVLLHDDAEIEPGWLEALFAAAEEHPEAGAVGGKVLFPDGRLQNAGMVLWRDATTSPPWVGEAPPASAFNRPRAVDYCGTSSLLIRAATWDAVGGLDERFYPVYFVDVDLAMAIRQYGQVVLYEPRSRIRHHRGASGNRRLRYFVTHRNRQLFVTKWGRELEDYEPREKGSQEAVERALARAENFAAELRCRDVPASGVREDRPAFDPAAQERRHLEMDLALQHAYVAHLTAALEETGALPAEEVAELRARLSAIESSRWWRLHGRLLPLLRRLHRLVAS